MVNLPDEILAESEEVEKTLAVLLEVLGKENKSII